MKKRAALLYLLAVPREAETLAVDLRVFVAELFEARRPTCQNVGVEGQLTLSHEQPGVVGDGGAGGAALVEVEVGRRVGERETHTGIPLYYPV